MWRSFYGSSKRNAAISEDTFIALQFFNDVAKDDDDEGEDIANAKDANPGSSTPETWFSECGCQTPFVH